MKKFDLIMLITGLVALVLSIITTIVLIFVFMAAVGSEIKSGKIEEGIKEFTSELGEYSEIIDGNGIHVESDDGTVVDIGPNGINVVENSEG